MKLFKSMLTILLFGVSATSSATELTYTEGKRIFEADVWNEINNKDLPFKLTRDVIITNVELKENSMIHHMTFYERKMPFKRQDWDEGNKDMLADNFCKKPYIKSFPIILRLDVTIKSDEFDNSPRKEIIITNSKDVCK